MSKSTTLQPEAESWALRKEEKKKKKEAKEKKKAAAEENDTEPVKKRKRDALPDEIEVNVDLPEPASKKAARKAKKAKTTPSTSHNADGSSKESKPTEGANGKEKKEEKRSEYGVWIGNLPWSATKDSLREFLSENSEVSNDQITRVHMPAPTKPPNPNWTTKPLNKGFAYVDFTTELAMYSIIALTETKMDGRALLIKNAKSFEGRPDKPKSEDNNEGKKAADGGNPPNKRVFVGNLAFDVTKEDLLQHYGQCGEIADIHMATFEDSGKCKGYAWVTFETVEAASSAVKGFLYKEESKKNDTNESDEEGAKKGKKRKVFVNRLMGRELRCEFAEDATTRYNKRHGKEKKEGMEGLHPDRLKQLDDDEQPFQRPRQQKQFRDKRPQGRRDPRTIKSGAAHTNAPRASQGIVKAEGTKITFD